MTESAFIDIDAEEENFHKGYFVALGLYHRFNSIHNLQNTIGLRQAPYVCNPGCNAPGARNIHHGM